MANLTRWDPFTDVTRFGLFDQPFDNLMRRFIRSVPFKDEVAVTISVDVNETDKAYTVKAEIPGVNKDDISVAIDGNQVSISAEVKKEKEEKEGEKVLHSERYYGSVYRSFTLPMDVDQSKSEAKYVNGVLELTLPKKAGGAAKRLEIH
jgi:HSP20 family protein